MRPGLFRGASGITPEPYHPVAPIHSFMELDRYVQNHSIANFRASRGGIRDRCRTGPRTGRGPGLGDLLPADRSGDAHAVGPDVQPGRTPVPAHRQPARVADRATPGT